MCNDKRLTPKQKRQARALADQEQQEHKKARLLVRPEFDSIPRVGVLPSISEKSPRNSNDPQSIMSLFMVWDRQNADTDGVWSWGLPRASLDIDWDDSICPHLEHLEKLTWSEILAQCTGGKDRHKKHHDMDVSDLVDEAFERWCEIQLDEFDTAFRFRFGNKPRLWGYRIHNVFHLVWWDPEHKIYPVD